MIKYYSEFDLFKITSLIHTRKWALYISTSLYTCQMRTATPCRVFRLSACSVSREPLNPHLQDNFLLLPPQEYRLPGAEILQHLCNTIRGIFRGVVIQRRSIMFRYLGNSQWRFFELESLARRAQEVQSQEEIRSERETR